MTDTQSSLDKDVQITELARRVAELEEIAQCALSFLEGSNPLHMSGGYRNMDLRARIDAALSGKDTK